MEISINTEKRARDVIVIGASAGGIQAVGEILPRLPATLPAIVGVVIHRGSRSAVSWATLFERKTNLRVIEPADGDRLVHGVVYVAPSDRHMIFDGEAVHLNRGPKEHHTRPAVDPLFTSAALALGPRVVGVVLTGGGQDGMRGVLAIRAARGISLVQKPSEAEYASMPQHAIIGDQVDAVLSLEEISEALVLLARGSVVKVSRA